MGVGSHTPNGVDEESGESCWLNPGQFLQSGVLIRECAISLGGGSKVLTDPPWAHDPNRLPQHCPELISLPGVSCHLA